MLMKMCDFIRYKVPKELKEFKLVGSATDKPVLLAGILEAHKHARVIVFTASLPATHRFDLASIPYEAVPVLYFHTGLKLPTFSRYYGDGQCMKSSTKIAYFADLEY